MDKVNVLRAVISGVSIPFLGIHIFLPNMKMDSITLGLLILSIVPWLAPIIKSIEVPGLGKVELQDLKKEVEVIKGAAISANQKADFSLAESSRAKGLQNENQTPAFLNEKLNSLAQEYNEIRAKQKASNARTLAMTSIVRQMVNIMPDINDFNIGDVLKDSDRGKRLTSYAYLLARPDNRYIDNLISTLVDIEDKPFGQYWALQALNKIVSINPSIKININSYNKLLQLKQRLTPGTDRYYELSKILKDIETKRGE